MRACVCVGVGVWVCGLNNITGTLNNFCNTEVESSQCILLQHIDTSVCQILVHVLSRINTESTIKKSKGHLSNYPSLGVSL